MRNNAIVPIGVLKEQEEEKRVALVPETCLKLLEQGFFIRVQSGAGE